jgi:hypothetical protein
MYNLWNEIENYEQADSLDGISAGAIICSQGIHGLTGCCVEAQEDRKRAISSKAGHGIQR